MKMRNQHKRTLRLPNWASQCMSWFSVRVHNLTRRQRIICATISGVIVLAAVVPTVQTIIDAYRYQLSSSMTALIGTVNQNLAAKLTYDSQHSQWQFNKATAGSSSMPAALMAQIGGGGKNDTSLYRTDFSRNPKKGITFTDSQTNLSFTMTPEFKLHEGRAENGRLVYPMNGGAKLIYSVKNNGMKEDIVLPKFIGKELAYSYKMNLPKTLEAKILDDGSVGIYSADPALFTSISTTTEMDADKLKSAREYEKNHLLFGIPAPVIAQSGGKKTKATAKFGLKGDVLTVTARNMDTVAYPASIDPSIVVTSTSDFMSGNNDDNISFDTSGQISRNLIGGGIGTWGTTTSLSSASNAVASAAYNGFMYTAGGTANGSSVYYAAINSNSSLGSWTSTSSLNTPRSYAGAAAYNGYLYAWGGYNTSTSSVNASVEYAKINSDGSLGTWQTAASMATGVCRAANVAYNGYLYALGGSTSPGSGCDSSSGGGINTVQYAQLKADGTVGTWQTTTNVAYGTSNQVIGAMAGAYNGYMYVLGGASNSASSSYANVQFAPIAQDGTLGSWTATASLPSAMYTAGFTIYDGYLYLLSNQSSSTTTYYTQAFVDGTVNTWFQTTKPLATGRWGGAATSYNGAIYYIGGNGATASVEYATLLAQMAIDDQPGVTSGFTTSRERAAAVAYNGCVYNLGGYGGSGNNYVNYTQYAPVNADGNITTAWPNQAFNTARADLAAVAYKGYLYVIGGYDSTNYYNTVQYAAINNDCSLGTWTSTTAFDTAGNARGGITAFAYNGYIFVTGGVNGSGNFSAVRSAPLNSNGTVGSWSATTSLPSAMNRHRTVVWGNRLYLLGGTTIALPNPNNGASTGSRPTGSGSANTYVATINDNGTIGSWTSATSLPYDIYEFGAEAMGGYLFVLGGFGSTGVSSITYRAKINSDGTLGNWALLYDRGSGFKIASESLVVQNGTMYTLGGRNDTSLTNTNRNVATSMIYAPNGGSGATGAWSSSSSLPAARSQAGSTAYNGYAYVTGGSSDGGTTLTDSVAYSKFSSQDGSLGSFLTDSHTLSSARMLASTVAYNGYLYSLGGKTSSSYYGNVQYAPIGSSGALTDNFSTSSTGFTTGSGSDTGRAGACTAIYNGRMYAIGGWDGTTYYNTARYTTIDSNTGALGSWSDSGHNFTNGRYGSSCFAANGYMYVLGGRDGSTNYNDVHVAPINSDGTLGTWVRTTDFNGARSHFVAGYNNGFVYLYGGCTTSACTAGYSDTQYASIGLDGKITTWQYRATTNTSNAPYLTTGFTYNGRIYQLGGMLSSSASATTTYVSTRVMARTAHYSKLIDLGQLSKISSIIYNGQVINSYAPGASPVSVQSVKSNGDYFSALPSSNINPGSDTCDATNPAYTRYVRVSITLDNTTSSLYADTSAYQAYLSDLTVNYTPVHTSPDTRLAHGKYFQNESLQPLDTCGA